MVSMPIPSKQKNNFTYDQISKAGLNLGHLVGMLPGSKSTRVAVRVWATGRDGPQDSGTGTEAWLILRRIASSSTEVALTPGGSVERCPDGDSFPWDGIVQGLH